MGTQNPFRLSEAPFERPNKRLRKPKPFFSFQRKERKQSLITSIISMLPSSVTLLL